jgi:hypothetical protein
MGICVSAEIKTQIQVADVIEKQILKDAVIDKATTKILLLGEQLFHLYIYFLFFFNL